MTWSFSKMSRLEEPGDVIPEDGDGRRVGKNRRTYLYSDSLTRFMVILVEIVISNYKMAQHVQ